MWVGLRTVVRRGGACKVWVSGCIHVFDITLFTVPITLPSHFIQPRPNMTSTAETIRILVGEARYRLRSAWSAEFLPTISLKWERALLGM
jgi:hypothetical protein